MASGAASSSLASFLPRLPCLAHAARLFPTVATGYAGESAAATPAVATMAQTDADDDAGSVCIDWVSIRGFSVMSS